MRRAHPARSARREINLLVSTVSTELAVSLAQECYNQAMKIKVIVHNAEEGGYWAEVPAIPGCATQGETFEELIQNLYEAVEGCLSVDVSNTPVTANDRILEIAV